MQLETSPRFHRGRAASGDARREAPLRSYFFVNAQSIVS
jgi:hypothetical protein